MMLKRLLIGGLIIGVATIAILFPERARGISCEDSCDGKSDPDKITCLRDVSNACQDKIKETQGQAATLQSLIAYLNNKIKGTQAQIQKTNLELAQLESEIANLSGQIAVLDISLEQLTEVLVNRIQATYKHENTNNPLVLLFSSGGLNDFFGRLRYLRLTQEHDRRVITETERTRTDFDMQKQAKEKKQAEVEALQLRLEKEKVTLASQQTAKQQLLTQTKNDEKKYQELLAKARAEFEAIQNILAGGGQEVEVGNVNEGEKIATIISGSSCNSSGSHLHFTITDNDSVQNPFNYLKSVDSANNSGGDPFNPSGSWNWPIDNPIQFNQGYGSTWAIQNTWVGQIYTFHNGIDIYNSSLSVKAIQSGTLYRGSFTTSSSCTLRYVRVDHKDSGIDSYYLHVNYL